MDKIEIVRMEANGKGRIRVGFDNGESCLLYRSECRRMHLEEGGQIAGEQYDELLSEVLGKRAAKRAMHLLEQMDRTEADLRMKLKKGEYPEACIDFAIDYVKKYHYLDDRRYARHYVHMAQEKKSRQRIRQDLYRKGISGSLIEEALEEEYSASEREQIERLLQKRNFLPEKSDEKEFRRTYEFLARRGFSGHEILRAMKSDSFFPNYTA